MTSTSRLVDRDTLRKYSRVCPWRSLVTLAAIYAAVITLAWLAMAVFGWWFTPVAIIMVGLLQRHLFLLNHDASHLALHPNRWVNDWVAAVFTALPLGIQLPYYRTLHMKHHRHVRDNEDPELGLLRSLECRTMTGAVLQGLTGITGLRGFLWWYGVYVRSGRRAGILGGSTLHDGLAYAAVWLPPIAITAANGWLWGFALYWVVPLACVYAPLMKLHSYSDHALAGYPQPQTEYDRSLSRRYGVIGEFVFNPLHSGEHLVHHLCASIPWYNLPAFARELEKYDEFRVMSLLWHSDGMLFGRSTVWDRVILHDMRARAAGTGNFEINVT